MVIGDQHRLLWADETCSASTYLHRECKAFDATSTVLVIVADVMITMLTNSMRVRLLKFNNMHIQSLVNFALLHRPVQVVKLYVFCEVHVTVCDLRCVTCMATDNSCCVF